MSIYTSEKLAQLYQKDLNRELQKQILVREAKAARNIEHNPKTKERFSLFMMLIGKAKKETRTTRAKPAKLAIKQEPSENLETIG
jgi:NRPS condensation-like uncharacterized protein